MTGFICHDDYLSKTAILSDEQLGRLFRACMKYHATGEIVHLEGIEGMAFEFIRFNIDKTEEAYQKKCEKNRQNRLSKMTNVDDRKQSLSIEDERQQTTTIKEKKRKDIYKEKDIDISFERFWKAYPRHTAKVNARKAFEKINPDEELLLKMISAVEKQKQSQQWQEERYIPHPATWLNQKRWEDEVSAAAPKQVIAQAFPQRDYSDVDSDMMNDLAEEMKQFQANGA